jgi:hypothetical protein
LTGSESLPTELKRREWAATGEQSSALGILDGFLEGALGLGRRVGQGEDDGAVVQSCHSLEDIPVECPANRGETHENGRLDEFDEARQALDLLAVVVIAGEVDFVVRKLVTTI